MQTAAQLHLSIWLFEYESGMDVVMVLAPAGYTPTKREVIDARHLPWEGEAGGDYLTHQYNVPLDAGQLQKDWQLPVIASRTNKPATEEVNQ